MAIYYIYRQNRSNLPDTCAQIPLVSGEFLVNPSFRGRTDRAVIHPHGFLGNNLGNEKHASFYADPELPVRYNQTSLTHPAAEGRVFFPCSHKGKSSTGFRTIRRRRRKL